MKIKCPSCQAVLNIPPEAAGKVVKCPCGTQLRAPGTPATGASSGTAAGAAAPQRAAPQRAAPQRAAPQASASSVADAGLFDELTEGDLQPIAQPGMPSAAAGPSGNTNKLLQEHAATAGGGSGGNFRVGPLASPWIRLGAAVIDQIIVSVMFFPVVFVLIITLGPMIVDTQAMDAAMSAATTDEERSNIFMGWLMDLFLFYLIATPLGAIVPVTIYAIMVTKSGQTPGKKLCKVRIVRADNKQLPGFVKGVVVRSWLGQLVYSIPIVGQVGVLLIFGAKRQTLWDIMAGTIVVES